MANRIVSPGLILFAAFLATLPACKRTGSLAEQEAVTTSNNSHGQQPSSAITSLESGIEFLMAQQADNGLWKSEHYGNLKDGAAVTCFILNCLPHPIILSGPSSPDAKQARQTLQNAVDALLPEIQKHGYVTNPDGPDYSNYASAMLLMACHKHDLDLPEDIRNELVEYLFRSQLDVQEGFDEQNPDFGGWDLSGWMTGERRSTGSNISVSATVIVALATISDMLDDEQKKELTSTMNRALKWTNRVAGEDGGFYFHPKGSHDGNKAGWHDGDKRHETRSYGTATADGLRILTCFNNSLEAEFVTERIKQTAAWLAKFTALDNVPGFEHEQGEASWKHGLRYYYYYSLSQSLDQLPVDLASRIATDIINTLIEEQNKDGSWTNVNARMREDDPMIATGFSIVALQNCQQFLKK